MTRITFNNPYFTPLNIKENIKFEEYYPINAVELSVPNDEEVIKAALDNPIGTPALGELIKPEHRVLIIVDDNTRTTPVDCILPPLLARIKAAGVEDAGIKFLVGSGTHRPMNEEELKRKLGIDIYQCYTVYNHDWEKTDSLINIGQTSSGVDIWISRHLMEADFVIGLGHIVPHRVAGYSGGGKIIQPGVCGPITTGQTHWLSAYYSAAEILGNPDNPVRREIEEVAIRAGLKFIINVVQDKTGHLAGVFAGDSIKAHRQGCALAQKIYGVSIKEKADIVISEAFPAELELWQATKALQAADVVVNPGGVIILLAECPEGISKSHGQLILKYGFRPLAEVESLVTRQEITNLNVASYLARVGNVVNKAKAILVSKGIPPAETRALGFDYAVAPGDALNMALGLVGEKARIAVLHQGSEILPLL